MPVTVSQRHEITLEQGVTAEKSSATLKFLIRGTDDTTEAITELGTAAPDDYVVGPYNLPAIGLSVEAVGPQLFYGTVTYGISRSTGGGGGVSGTAGNQYSFEIGGGTDHITQALGASTNYGVLGDAPDYKGAIGATDEGVVGIDIIAPRYEFAITKTFANSALTTTYKLAVNALVGTTNIAAFEGLEIDRVLFLGASGSQRDSSSSGKTEVTFRFAVGNHVTGLQIGDITGIDKKAWQALTVRYAEVEDTVAKTIVKRPTSVHVHTVYRQGNFATLGL